MGALTSFVWWYRSIIIYILCYLVQFLSNPSLLCSPFLWATRQGKGMHQWPFSIFLKKIKMWIIKKQTVITMIMCMCILQTAYIKVYMNSYTYCLLLLSLLDLFYSQRYNNNGSVMITFILWVYFTWNDFPSEKKKE